jgi:hypothetical protein
MKCRHSTVLAYLMIQATLQIPIKYHILVLLLLEVVKYRKNMKEVGMNKLLKLFPPKYTVAFRREQNM